MSDRLTKEERSRLMSKVKSSGTGPEVLLRHALWRRGFRYRTNVRNLPGTPDIVLPRYRTAVFVNGCFWHGHEGCKEFVVPKTNRGFWEEKIARNRERDQEAWRRLEAEGWHVVTVWECELKKEAFDSTLSKIGETLLDNLSADERLKSERKAAIIAARAEAAARKEKLKGHEEELEALFGTAAKGHAPECQE